MSQDDLVIANQTFPATRSDLNSNLQALGSLMSGASAPATTYAYMWWADTTNGVLKQRNSSDNAWVIRATLSDDRVVTKTSAYTVTLGDYDKLILCSASGGAFPINLPAAATAGDGFRVTIKKTDSTTNAVTIDGNASETIDGSTTLTCDNQYDSWELICDGSAWYISNNSLFTMTRTQVAIANGATVDLGTAKSNLISITGTGSNITSLGSSASLSNPVYFVRIATGGFDITYHGTNLLTPGAVDIKNCNAGDSFIAIYLGSGTWRITDYNQAAGGLINISSINTGALAGFRNSLINGAMDTWQRGTSFTPTAGVVTYTADRWCTFRVTTAAYTVSKQTSGAPSGFQSYMRIQRTAGDTTTNRIYLGQSLETIDSIRYQGKVVTISYYARVGATWSPTSGILQGEVVSGTGTDENVLNTFTGATQVSTTNSALTTSWVRYSVTGTLGAAITQIGARLSYVPTGTAGATDYLDITGLQIEQGNQATPFEVRHITIEKALCYRFFYSPDAQQTTGIGWQGASISTTSASFIFPFPVTMRTTPTFSAGTVGNWSIYDYTPTGIVVGSSAALNSSNPQSASVKFTTGASLTANRSYMLSCNISGANMQFIAEL
jgi:hypothetical protein